LELMKRRGEIARWLSEIDQQLEPLINQVGQPWISELFSKPGKNAFENGYTLNDGRRVKIERLEQYFTYAGLLEGAPTDRMNERIMREAVEEERKRSYSEQPYLVPPVISPIEWDREHPYPFGRPEA
jgi:hypothetical protein